MTRKKIFRRVFELFLHTLWPVSCPVCGKLGSVLCDECRKILMPSANMPEPRCLYCENLVPCPVHTNTPAIHAAAVYTGQVRELILNLKSKNFRALGSPLGIAAAELFISLEPESAARNFDALIPVPLHIGSERKYNQSFEIARGMSHVWNVPVIDAAQWSRVIQKRIGLSAAERKLLTQDAFVISKKAAQKIRGIRVALVDDVCTTGTTLSCLAQTCENAGAIVTGAYTLARTVLEPGVSHKCVVMC